MNRKLLAKAQKKIDEKRHFAEERAKNFLLTALRDEEFKQLYTKQKEMEIDMAKKLAFGQDVSFAELDEIKHKQEFILKSKGLNGIDLMPNYECKDCLDTGYTHGDLCSCLKREINKELLAFSGFTHKLASFEESKVQNKAFEIMEKWCDLNSKKINVLLSGKTGTGKTFLTECIANKLMQKSCVVLFTTAFNLNNSLLSYHTCFDENRNDLIAPYLEAEYLIIDDLGTEPMFKNVTKEYLYLILNERMLNERSTIITTNLTPAQILDTYGERIFSRLMDNRTTIRANIDGVDMRLKKD